MNSINSPATKLDLRKFGLLLGALFLFFGEARPVLKHEALRVAPLVIAFALALAALVYPRALGPVRSAWLKLGDVLGAINSRIILSILYWVGIVPLALLRKPWGVDKMARKFEPTAESYRVVRGDPIAKNEMERLF